MRILVADDSSIYRRMLEVMLSQWGFEVVSAKDGSEAWQILQSSDAPPLAILDWMMPGIDGVQVCQAVRQQGGESYVYLLLLTANDAQEDVVAGLDAGADDYLTKPFNPHELRMRLRAGQRILELQAQLRFQATHDSLTGLWSRGAMFDLLERERIRAQRTGRPLGLIMSDIDHFKRINDTYGHQAGDMALKAVAQRLSVLVRPYDIVGRYGGEEFIIVLPDCEASRAFDIAERLRAGVSERVIDAGGEAISVTLSLGVVSSDVTPATDVDTLVRAADAALYQAKRNGRNRVEVARAVLSAP